MLLPAMIYIILFVICAIFIKYLNKYIIMLLKWIEKNNQTDSIYWHN